MMIIFLINLFGFFIGIEGLVRGIRKIKKRKSGGQKTILISAALFIASVTSVLFYDYLLKEKCYDVLLWIPGIIKDMVDGVLFVIIYVFKNEKDQSKT